MTEDYTLKSKLSDGQIGFHQLSGREGYLTCFPSLASVSLLILSSKVNSDVAVSRLRCWIPEYHAPTVLAYLVVLSIAHPCLVFSQYFASGIIVQKKNLLNQWVMMKQI